VDDRILAEALGIEVPATKDPAQRKACGCVASRDVGMYESCLFGCRYCYAVTSFGRAKANFDAHDPESPSLLGRGEAAG
jgi:DNA repair photolyase